jgi:hypothetical protein
MADNGALLYGIDTVFVRIRYSSFSSAKNLCSSSSRQLCKMPKCGTFFLRQIAFIHLYRSKKIQQLQ